MAYILNKSNGQQLTVLNDGLTDNVLTSLTLLGKNVSGFGNSQNENILYLLENFANSSLTGGQPRSPISGQIWFDTNPNINRPLVFDGTSWRPLSVAMYDSSPRNQSVNAMSNPRYPFAASQPGDFWIDSVNKQLYIVTSTASDVSLIGPEYVPGFGTTKMSSVVMFDSTGNPHPVIQTILNDEVITIQSNVTFDSSSTSQVAGFPKIYRGITFKNYSTSSRYSTSTSDVILRGINDQLDTSYPRRGLNEHIQGSWFFDYGSQLNFGNNSESMLGWNSSTSIFTIGTTGAIKLTSNGVTLTYDGTALTPNGTVALGNSVNAFSTIYAANVTATTITATDIYESGSRVLTAATLPSVGIVSIQGTANQISVATVSGVVTLSLPNNIAATNVTATNISAVNIAGSVVTDSGSRVVTAATLPFSVSTITGNTNQISVSMTGSTANLGLSNTVVLSNLTATTISATSMYENGFRVLTSATLAAAAVTSISGTSNQITTTNTNGVVTLGLSDTVAVNTLNATTASVGTLSATSASVVTLVANNGTITALAATNANIANSVGANSANIGTLTVTGNAKFNNDATATNVYASGNMIGYNLRGSYGNFSSQLNATAAVVNTLTVTTLKDAFGAVISKIDNDGTLASNSDLNLATQKAIVTYVTTLMSTYAYPTVPAGTVFFMAMTSAPSGYLVCDGSTLSTVNYPDLFAAIGHTYGGSLLNFKLPDLRGQFIRGLDLGAGIDPGRTIGSTQAGMIETHAHYEFANSNTGYGNIGNYPNAAPSANASGDSSGASYNIGTNNSDPATVGLTSHTGGTETRPMNVALTPMIKY